MATPFNNIPLILAAVAVLLAAAAATTDTNVLLTGQSLSAGEYLTIDPSRRPSVTLSRDCDLLLRNDTGIHSISNTKGMGKDCILNFTANGRLQIVEHTNKTVWITPNFYSLKGDYAAVLKPDGEFAIYGPSLWASPAPPSEPTNDRARNDRGVPFVRNLLFSGQVLSDGESLEAYPYKLAVNSPCTFAVEDGSGSVWEQKPNSNSRRCFVRLNYHGQLSLLDDLYLTLWSSNSYCTLLPEGEYVLVMRYDGIAAVYGRKLWSNIGVKINYSGGIREVTDDL